MGHWNDMSGTSSRLGTAGKLEASSLKYCITITTMLYYSELKTTSASLHRKQRLLWFGQTVTEFVQNQ
jgi:hypothetical protein